MFELETLDDADADVGSTRLRLRCEEEANALLRLDVPVPDRPLDSRSLETKLQPVDTTHEQRCAPDMPFARRPGVPELHDGILDRKVVHVDDLSGDAPFASRSRRALRRLGLRHLSCRRRVDRSSLALLAGFRRS
jgi:hypothetical protein